MPIDNVMEPSNKRRKMEHRPVTKLAGPVNVSVKQELSPSPPPSLALRTSGTKRVNLPLACRKTQAGWKECRDKWLLEEITKLERLGLQVTKKLVREDGLAMDWTSPVPVCPLTLRAPSPEIEAVHENPTHTSALSAGSSTDPLGHALRDQSSLAGLSVGRKMDTAPAPKVPLKNMKHRIQHSIPEKRTNDLSNFPVVGAALLKRERSPNPDSNTHPVFDEPVQSEHRKLFPADLRIPPAMTGNKETFKDWRARRRAWVAKETEKVEGYTGQHARGFKYDGDDVIIFLQGRHNLDDNSRQRGKHKHVPPSPVSRLYAKATETNGEMQSAPLTSPVFSARSPHLTNVLPEGHGASGRLNVSLREAGEKTLDQHHSRHSKATIVDDPPHDVPCQAIANMSDLRGREADDMLDATQSRGLGFLEQYLQMFDSDRGGLGVAYTANATLSLLTEEGYCNVSNASKAPSRPGTPNMIQVINTGPVAIVNTLRQLSDHLHHSTLCDIVYNIAALDDMSAGGLLLTCDGAMIHPESPIQLSEWSFSRTFVLKQNLEENPPLWPMKIVAERLTICRTSAL